MKLFASPQKMVASIDDLIDHTVQERIIKAKNITEVLDTVHQYGGEVSAMASTNIARAIIEHRGRLQRMLICVLIMLALKVGFAVDKHGTLFLMETLWDSVKWTAPILAVFYLLFGFFSASFVSKIIVDIQREGIMGISLCYDKLFTQAEMRRSLMDHTLEANQSKYVYDKGYLASCHESFLMITNRMITLSQPSKLTIKEHAEKYMLFIGPQFNSWTNFTANLNAAHAGPR